MNYKKNKTLELIFAGIIIGFVCGMPLGLGLFSEAANHIEIILTITLVTLITFALIIVLIYNFRDKIFNWLKLKLVKKPKEIREEIKELSIALINRNKKKIENSSVNLLEQLIGLYTWYRIRKWMFNTLIGIIIAFTGLAGSALLYQQNKILTAQEQWFISQSASADNQSIETTRSSLFNHAIEIQKLLTENPVLFDYFYSGKEINEKLSNEDRNKAKIIAEMLCDMLDHAANSKILTGETREGWKTYAKDMMEDSPVFRDYFISHKDWYPSIGKWINFREYK